MTEVTAIDQKEPFPRKHAKLTEEEIYIILNFIPREADFSRTAAKDKKLPLPEIF